MPCANGGSCEAFEQGYKCNCKPKFTGTYVFEESLQEITKWLAQGSNEKQNQISITHF